MCIWAIANLLHNGLTWPKIPRLNDRHTQLTLDSPELAWGSIITFLLLVDREWSQNNAFIIIIAQWSLKIRKQILVSYTVLQIFAPVLRHFLFELLKKFYIISCERAFIWLFACNPMELVISSSYQKKLLQSIAKIVLITHVIANFQW